MLCQQFYLDLKKKSISLPWSTPTMSGASETCGHTGSYRPEPALVKHLHQNIHSLIGKITPENSLPGDSDRYKIHVVTV